MKSLYQHAPSQPFHISAGAVLVNDTGEILVHHARAEAIPEDKRYKPGGLSDAYLLMRESVENGETLEEAVLRGLSEEFGADAAITRYLGSIQAHIDEDGGWEKTTLNFLTTLTAPLGERHLDDGESMTDLEWHAPRFLIEKMRAQGARTAHGGLDESKIIETYLKYGVV